ncbi:MAG: hypothetical protein ACTHQQ_05985, partial [Solirubrobacteraceae bacterium]
PGAGFSPMGATSIAWDDHRMTDPDRVFDVVEGLWHQATRSAAEADRLVLLHNSDQDGPCMYDR